MWKFFVNSKMKYGDIYIFINLRLLGPYSHQNIFALPF